MAKGDLRRNAPSLAGSSEPEEASLVAEATEGRRPFGFGDELRQGRTAPMIAAALVAWAITVAPVGLSRGAPAGAGVLAIAALLAGMGGPALLSTRPRLGRLAGISLFLACATGTWLLGSAAIHPLRLDPVRGIFGAVAWGIFALSWSDRWGPKPKIVPPDPDAPLLLARASLPALAVPTATFGVIAAIGFLIVAFRIRDPDRALIAQALAVACAVAVVSASATVAVSRGKVRRSGGRRLTHTAGRALLLLFTFAIAGAVVVALR